VAMIGGIVFSAIFGERYDMLFIIPGTLVFLGFWCYGFVTQFKEQDFVGGVMNQIKTLKPAFRIPLSVISKICFIFTGCAFVLFAIYGGGPGIMDGEFCITSHGDFVKTITEAEYDILRIFERYSWFSIMIPLATNFLIYLKKKMNTPIETMASDKELDESGLLKKPYVAPIDRIKNQKKDKK
jgi:hypothetical protein